MGFFRTLLVAFFFVDFGECDAVIEDEVIRIMSGYYPSIYHHE